MREPSLRIRHQFSHSYEDWADYFERAPRVGDDFLAAMAEMGRNPLGLEERVPFD